METTTGQGLCKGVDYSYPSSPNAVKAGRSREGCWTVTLHGTSKSGKPIVKPLSHHETQDQACTAAAALPQPWGAVWRRYMRHAIARAERKTPDEIYQRKATDGPSIK